MVTLFLNGQQQQQITRGYLISKWSNGYLNNNKNKYHVVTLFLNGQQQQQITRGYLISKWSTTTTTNNTWLPYF